MGGKIRILKKAGFFFLPMYFYFYRDYPTVPNGKIRFKLLNDSRPDSMVIEHTYEYFTD